MALGADNKAYLLEDLSKCCSLDGRLTAW